MTMLAAESLAAGADQRQAQMTAQILYERLTDASLASVF